MTPHATPQDTIAALRARYTGELDGLTTTCGDCGGAGYWWADGKGPSYVNSYGEPPRHKVACERCGGDFDSPGTGSVEAAEDDPQARDARLKLALLDQVEAGLEAYERGDWHYMPTTVQHLATLRLLAESAGEAVAW